MKVSIIIPCFNEGPTVEEVIDRVRAVEIGLDRQIIVVDDGSTDGTVDILKRVEERLRGEDIVFHYSVINLGKGAAVRAGLSFATGDIWMVQDADLELNPDEYPNLLAPIISGEADVVYGVRDVLKGNRLVTKAANVLLSLLTTVLYHHVIRDMETAYKIMRREVIEPVRLRGVGFEIEAEVTAKLLRLGHRIREVPLNYYVPRTALEGKKIDWYDGVKAIFYLFKYRIVAKDSFLSG